MLQGHSDSDLNGADHKITTATKVIHVARNGDLFYSQSFAALVAKTATYCSYHPNGAQLCVTAPPHPPVMVLSLLQQVLVSSEALFLVADPAALTETYKGLSHMLT